MIFRTETLIENLKVFKGTTDTTYTKFDTNASVLEIKASGLTVEFISGNSEYVQKLIVPNSDPTSQFDVSIDSVTFFNLLFKTTTETIELTIEDKVLKVVGNGTFYIPLIYIDDDMYKVTDIPVEQVTVDTTISYEDLNSIVAFNSKQFDRAMSVDGIQKLFYLDDKGCITFNTGAVVTSFNLGQPFKILLKPIVADLFKNFSLSKSESISLKIGHRLVGSLTYPVLALTDGVYSLVLVCPMDSLLTNYPIDKIRDRATKDLGNEAVLEVTNLSDALDRFKIFVSTDDFIEISADSTGLSMNYNSNNEKVLFESAISLSGEYKFHVSLNYLNSVLKNIPQKFIKFRFGDSQSLTVISQNIYHVIPEVTVVMED